MMIVYISFFVQLFIGDLYNTNEICLDHCSEQNIDFESEVVEPFSLYLDEIGITGNSELDRYINFVNYVAENEDDYQLISRELHDSSRLYPALDKLGLVNTDGINYDTLLKLVKKSKPKSPVTDDFKNIYKQLKKHDYNVSTGLTAIGISMALTDHGLDNEPYRNLIILTIAPFAYRR